MGPLEKQEGLIIWRHLEVMERTLLTSGAWARLVPRQSAVVIAMGVVAGLAAAAALIGYFDQLLFGLTAFDPATYVTVAIGFRIVGSAAPWIPARRSMRVDPLVRCEPTK